MGHENVGFDLGTAFSMVSYLDDVKRDDFEKITGYTFKAIEPPDGGRVAQDTIVAINGRKKAFAGYKARLKTDEETVRVFKNFKMLLSEEDDADKIQNWGYDEEYTPSAVTEIFVRTVLNAYINDYLNGEPIHNLVVGVPEIWFENPNTVATREKLENIIKNSIDVENVRLVSEPALACAFGCENYKKKKGRLFEGHLLLIDFGGGTLDIALCHVKNVGDSNEISVLHRTGIGDSKAEDLKIDELGIGGVLFLETTMRIALEEAGIERASIVKNNEYYSILHKFEDNLKASGDEICEVFEEADCELSEVDETFMSFKYDGKSCKITYGMLAKAFNERISGALDKKIGEMINYMDENGIVYSVEEADTFKIAMVGGFCNFYLTRKQIEKNPYLKRGGLLDKRYNDIINNAKERECAIAYGAALMAESIVDFKQVAPFTISFVDMKEENGQIVPGNQICPVIVKGTELEENKPEWLKYSENGEPALISGSEIPFLRIDYGNGIYVCKRPAISLTIPKNKVVNLGLSVDHSSVYSLHIVIKGDFISSDINLYPEDIPMPPKRLSDKDTLLGGFNMLEKE